MCEWKCVAWHRGGAHWHARGTVSTQHTVKSYVNLKHKHYIWSLSVSSVAKYKHSHSYMHMNTQRERERATKKLPKMCIVHASAMAELALSDIDENAQTHTRQKWSGKCATDSFTHMMRSPEQREKATSTAKSAQLFCRELFSTCEYNRIASQSLSCIHCYYLAALQQSEKNKIIAWCKQKAGTVKTRVSLYSDGMAD